ncbi:MAG TPA: hypothetical protein VN599_00250 [Rudaea sp.]|nr:hypothetical protein [Rudaea sp.]
MSIIRIAGLFVLSFVCAQGAFAQNLCGGTTTNGTGQTYNSAVILTCDTTLTDSSGGTIAFQSSVDGAFALAVSTSGATGFGGAVGGTTALSSLNASGGSLALAGSVNTTGALTLASNSGALSIAGDLSGSNVNLTGINGITLNNNTTATGTLKLVSSSNITQTAGTITATTLTGNASASVVLTNVGNAITNLGAFSANSFSLTNAPALTVSGAVNSTGALDLVAISGGLTVAGSGSLTFGNGTTTGNVTGDYSQSGTLNLHATPTTADHLAITGNATLGGTLSVAFSGTPAIGQSFTVLTASNIAGTFATVNVSGLPVSQAATVGYNTNSAVLTIVAALSITTDPGSASFVAGDNTVSTPVAVSPGLTATTGSSPTLASATVVITGNFQAGEDVLSFTNDGSTMGNIVGSYNATTGVLTLTSAGATLAQAQSALRSVTYTDTAITPNTATRTVSFTAVDSASTTSNTATRTITVTATDQTPIVTTTGSTTNYVGGTAAVTIDGSIAVSDLDSPTQSSATVSIGTGFHSGDTLGYTNTSSALFGNISASYNAATGVMTLTSAGATATDAQWSNALSSVTFSSASTSYGSRTIAFATNDGTKTSAAATDTVNVIVATSQAITNFTANLANPTFVPGGTGTFTVSATGGASGNPVTFSSATSAACTTGGTNGATITMLSPGSCTLHADQAGNANYTAAPQVSLNVTIARATQTITFTSTAPTNAMYNGPAYTVTATADSGLPVTLAISGASAPVCALSGSSSGSLVTFTAPGTCLIDADQVGDGTYAPAPQAHQSFAVGPGVQTLSITAPTSIELANGPATMTATASSGLPVTVTSTTPTICTVSGTAPTFSIALLAPGACTLDVTQIGFPNYASVSQNVTIAVLAPLVPTPMLDRRALLLLTALIGLFALTRVRRT